MAKIKEIFETLKLLKKVHSSTPAFQHFWLKGLKRLKGLKGLKNFELVHSPFTNSDYNFLWYYLSLILSYESQDLSRLEEIASQSITS